MFAHFLQLILYSAPTHGQADSPSPTFLIFLPPSPPGLGASGIPCLFLSYQGLSLVSWQDGPVVQKKIRCVHKSYVGQKVFLNFVTHVFILDPVQGFKKYICVIVVF